MFRDEASPEWDLLFERVCDQGAVVSGLWHLEVANLLLQVEKRGRITTGDVAMRLELIAELPIATDNETTARAWRGRGGTRMSPAAARTSIRADDRRLSA